MIVVPSDLWNEIKEVLRARQFIDDGEDQDNDYDVIGLLDAMEKLEQPRRNEMRLYTTEDRSLPAKAALTRIEGQSLQAIEHLTDWTAEEFDQIADMHVGEERVFNGLVYVKRTH